MVLPEIPPSLVFDLQFVIWSLLKTADYAIKTSCRFDSIDPEVFKKNTMNPVSLSL